MSQTDNELKESDFLKILWDYFSLHGNQRIQIMNFYVVLETFFITALLTLFQLGGDLTLFRFVLGFAIIFFSFIFLALDTRTKKMIKLSEGALKLVEQKYGEKYGKEIMIFSIEQEKTLVERRESRMAKWFLSYTNLFHLIYIFFILIGFLGIILEIYNVYA